MKDILLNNICKVYGDNRVLTDFSAVIPQGKVSCVMGPSGRGKTTLLRLLMGLETPDSGNILGMTGLRLSAVFQEDRLCENLSPISNIRLACPQRAQRDIAVALESMGLAGGCIAQPVRTLSGGMRRRVALLRALMADYDILFLDEPFKGLDAATKVTVIDETRRRISGKSVLLVTHDPEEATALGADHYVAI